PRGSTLFPYTTLFRSAEPRVAPRTHALVRAVARALRPAHEQLPLGARQRGLALVVHGPARGHFAARRGRRALRIEAAHAQTSTRDRKSTRLNSSHVKI